MIQTPERPSTLNSVSTRENILLIHGFLMNPLEMRLIGKRLKKSGFNVYYIKYPSVTKTSAENAKIIYRKIKQLQLPQLHIVAHSLGGLVTLHLFNQFPDLPINRVVMLGTPINGSLIAKRMQHWFIISPLFTRSMTNALSGEGLPAWTNHHDWGMIAGNKNFGIATIFNNLPKESDGTVMIEETKHQKQTDHIVVHSSHTGLLFSSIVARLTANFLATGRFKI